MQSAREQGHGSVHIRLMVGFFVLNWPRVDMIGDRGVWAAK